jgi:hypothetical protein
LSHGVPSSLLSASSIEAPWSWARPPFAAEASSMTARSLSSGTMMSPLAPVTAVNVPRSGV